MYKRLIDSAKLLHEKNTGILFVSAFLNLNNGKIQNRFIRDLNPDRKLLLHAKLKEKKTNKKYLSELYSLFAKLFSLTFTANLKNGVQFVENLEDRKNMNLNPDMLRAKVLAYIMEGSAFVRSSHLISAAVSLLLLSSTALRIFAEHSLSNIDSIPDPIEREAIRKATKQFISGSLTVEKQTTEFFDSVNTISPFLIGSILFFIKT